MCFSCHQRDHDQFICLACQSVDGPCSHDKIRVDYRWRAPRKTNRKGWKRIANGNVWWENKTPLVKRWYENREELLKAIAMQLEKRWSKK